MNKISVKRESAGTFGKRPAERTSQELLDYGVINLNKPQGPTSHQTAVYVKQVLDLRKTGHSGTLDPNVSGVLPIGLGKATRVLQYLLLAPKEYIGVAHIHKEVPEQKIRAAIAQFLGVITQLPPRKSSVKRVERQRTIYSFDILEIDGKDVLFRTRCQAGTYIRKLIFDLGQKLGGAHMAELRRVAVGPFDESTLVTLQDVADAYHFWKKEQDETELRRCVQPIENAVAHLPKLWVLDTALQSLSNGRDLGVPGVSKLEQFEKDALVALLTLKGELVAVGKAALGSEEIMAQEKGLAVDVSKIYLRPI